MSVAIEFSTQVPGYCFLGAFVTGQWMHVEMEKSIIREMSKYIFPYIYCFDKLLYKGNLPHFQFSSVPYCHTVLFFFPITNNKLKVVNWKKISFNLQIGICLYIYMFAQTVAQS